MKKTLPKLAIAGLNLHWDRLYEDVREGLITESEADRQIEEEAEKLGKIAPLTWCNGFEDTLFDHDAKDVFSALGAIGREFGDFTCTVYGDTEDGKRIEWHKDTMDDSERVRKELLEQL